MKRIIYIFVIVTIVILGIYQQQHKNTPLAPGDFDAVGDSEHTIVELN